MKEMKVGIVCNLGMGRCLEWGAVNSRGVVEKVYDHLVLNFLDHVLQRKGFNTKWRSWMRGCLSSTSFVVLVHGNAKGKQGDPFSAFLFTFVADVLSGRMIKLEESGLLEGFIVGRDRTRVSLLRY